MHQPGSITSQAATKPGKIIEHIYATSHKGKEHHAMDERKDS